MKVSVEIEGGGGTGGMSAENVTGRWTQRIRSARIVKIL